MKKLAVWVALCLAVTLLQSGPSAAAAPTLTFTRLDPVAGQIVDSNPNLVGAANGVPVVQLRVDTSGQELWAVTPTGLTLLADIASGVDSSGAYNFVPVSGGALFSADDGVHGREPWFTDGTPGNTRLLKDTVADSVGGYPGGFTPIGAKSVFRINEGGSSPNQLWVTDGTAAGTSALTSLALAPGDDGVQGIAAVPGTNKAVFIVRSTGNPAQLWVTDGTVPGTALVMTFEGASPAYVNCAGGSYVWLTRVSPGSLWRTDGTSAGTVQVKEFDAAAAPECLGDLGSKLVFNATTTAGGQEPWVSDGTTAGTVQLADINPGSTGSRPYNVGVYAGRVYFSAVEPVHGRELWSTTGTPSGTVLHADTLPGADWGYAEAIFGRGGNVYYVAYDITGSDGSLWAVDAATPGTQAKVAGATTFTQYWDQKLVGGTIVASGRMSEFTSADGAQVANNIYTASLAGSAPRMAARPAASGKRAAATVTWRAATSPDSAVTAYVVRVYSKASGGKLLKSKTVSASSRRTTITGLKRFKRYWVTVQPVAGGVAGGQSARVRVRTR